MRIIRESSELGARGRKVCVAIGVFDGVHLGHEQVIRQMIADAEQHEALAVVITFDRHPNAVVAPDRTPELIYSLPQKLRAIQLLGAESTWLIKFDQDFSRQSGEEFIRKVARDFGHVQSVCVGSTFTFGHKRSGNVELLRRLGAELRFTVHGLAAVALDGETVSSTRIRDAIRAAARYLRANRAPADMPNALFRYNNSQPYVRAVTAYAEVMRAEPEAYRGFYHWQVYYLTTRGDILLPVGYGP